MCVWRHSGASVPLIYIHIVHIQFAIQRKASWCTAQRHGLELLGCLLSSSAFSGRKLAGLRSPSSPQHHREFRCHSGQTPPAPLKSWRFVFASFLVALLTAYKEVDGKYSPLPLLSLSASPFFQDHLEKDRRPTLPRPPTPYPPPQ